VCDVLLVDLDSHVNPLSEEDAAALLRPLEPARVLYAFSSSVALKLAATRENDGALPKPAGSSAGHTVRRVLRKPFKIRKLLRLIVDLLGEPTKDAATQPGEAHTAAAQGSTVPGSHEHPGAGSARALSDSPDGSLLESLPAGVSPMDPRSSLGPLQTDPSTDARLAGGSSGTSSSSAATPSRHPRSRGTDRLAKLQPMNAQYPLRILLAEDNVSVQT